MVLHAVLIVVHTSFAVVALASGLWVLHSGRALRLHAVAISGMTVAVYGAVALGFSGYPTPSRWAFIGLAVLAAVMTARVMAALRHHPVGATTPPPPSLIEPVGFNVISLVAGGMIVPVLRLGGGAVGVIAALVVSVVVMRGYVAILLRRAEGGSDVARRPRRHEASSSRPHSRSLDG